MGKVFRTPELEAIAHLAFDHDLLIVSDEVYELLIFDEIEHRSIAALAGMRDRIIVVPSASFCKQDDALAEAARRLMSAMHRRPGSSTAM
jgi:bifunctional pyridoxal-dependent enzyme with beta-cystathionase and maltose regulon repressor activities